MTRKSHSYEQLCNSTCAWYEDCRLYQLLSCNKGRWVWLLLANFVIFTLVYIVGMTVAGYRPEFEYSSQDWCDFVMTTVFTSIVCFCWLLSWIAVGWLWIGLGSANWSPGLCWAIWLVLGAVYFIRCWYGDQAGRSFRECFRIDEWLYGTRQERREMRNAYRRRREQQESSIKFNTPGVDSEIIENVTSIMTYKEGAWDDKHGTTSCTICLDEFQEGESIRFLPCLHTYHVACIDEWLKQCRVCPVCKNDIIE